MDLWLEVWRDLENEFCHLRTVYCDRTSEPSVETLDFDPLTDVSELGLEMRHLHEC